MATVTAEARPGAVLATAGRAAGVEAGAALIAEPTASRILGGATRAGDDGWVLPSPCLGEESTGIDPPSTSGMVRVPTSVTRGVRGVWGYA
jgi:hypothetical protein